MKTMTRTNKAIVLTLVVAMLFVATLLALTACNDPTEPVDPVTTKYDATFDASIVMGAMGAQSFASVFSGAYVTKNNNQYSLTVIFTAGEMSVGGMNGTVFVDDNPTTQETVNGVKDGTIGFYKADGTLVTEGVKVTYSSGENYAVNPAHEKVYYVQSAEFPVDGLRATYDLTLYINSDLMGKQFIKDVYDAKVTLDLESGEVVEAITGLGVATRGTVPSVESDKYTKYGAELNAVISMGQDVNFTKNLFDGVYVIKNNGKYEITLIFKTGVVEMPFGNELDGFLTNSECPGYRGAAPFMPVWGYYVDEELVEEGVTLTYSSGEDYVTVSAGSYYYVKSMTFTVDTLEEEYILSLCVMAGNDDSTSGQQFPYTTNAGTLCNAVLTIDLTDAKTVDSIDEFLGVATLGTVSVPVEPVSDKYTEYGAELNAVVSMGQDVNFTKNLFDGVYVIKNNDKYEITLIFKADTINMPFGNVMDGFLTNSECPGYNGADPFMPVWGYYVDEDLVEDGVTLTYSSGEDYVTVSAGSYYYVKSMTFTVDTLEDEFVLSLCVMAGNQGATSGQQFPYTTSGGVLCNAVLTIDLTDAETVDSIANLLGVATLGEVEAE